MNYTIVQGQSVDDLVCKVQRAMNEGWLLQGGVATGDNGRYWIFQAMVKTDEPKERK